MADPHLPWIDDNDVEEDQAILIESWLDRLLLKVLDTPAARALAISPGRYGGLRSTGLDRKKLIDHDLEPRQIDLIYRSLYLHATGMFLLLKNLNLSPDMEEKFMAAFKLITTYLPKLGIDVLEINSREVPLTKMEMKYNEMCKEFESRMEEWEREKIALETKLQEEYEEKLKGVLMKLEEVHKVAEAKEQARAHLSDELDVVRADLKAALASNDALTKNNLRLEKEMKELEAEGIKREDLERFKIENAHLTRRLTMTQNENKAAMERARKATQIIEEKQMLEIRLSLFEKENSTSMDKLERMSRKLRHAESEVLRLTVDRDKLLQEKEALTDLYHTEATKCAELCLEIQQLQEEKQKP